jgi:CDGSH iron-sulfur domain-containing protein 3
MEETTMGDMEDWKPCVPMYGPITCKNLEHGKVYLYCTCGLSDTQPFCDHQCKDGPFEPLEWTVPKHQRIYSLCNCKYTKAPPFCDSTHIYLPLEVAERQRNCTKDHSTVCFYCGFKPTIK